jgi:putative component of toxin-antitoxin plasmid stabilization module
MAFWEFKDYLTERGENEIRLWLDGLSKKARIKIDRRIRYLANVQYFHGEPQYIKRLVGYEGIYEIRVVFGGDQYRPLGCYGPDEGQFTLLIGAMEQGDRFIPRDAPDIAIQRRAIILSDRSRICDHFD